MAPFVYPLILLAQCILLSGGAEVVPPWENQAKQNPCINEPNGWQLLYWPLDGKCYKIFQKGFPCPESMELTLGKGGIAECQCPPGTAQSPRDAICYKLFTKGPCDKNEYFAPITADPKRHRWGVCQPTDVCKNGDIYWPKDKKCYGLAMRGPCREGRLLGEKDGVGECMCNQTTMPSNYWESSATCYEHYTQGPCENGQVFFPGGVCSCNEKLKQFYPETNLCFTIGTIGPCSKGNKFTEIYNATTERENGICLCKDGFVQWPDTGQCYRPFTQGPCQQEEILEANTDGENPTLQCIPKPCGPGKLYFPGGKGCHKVGTRGPCPEDQVVLFQDNSESSRESISYQGVCGCPLFQQSTESFYPTLRGLKPNENGKCLTTRKLNQPLTNSNDEGAKNFSSNESDPTTFPCNKKRGMVLWTDNSCQLLYNQGPCKDGEWIVPDRGKGQRHGRGWKMGKCECRPGYTITTANRGMICQSPSMMLARFLNSNTHSEDGE